MFKLKKQVTDSGIPQIISDFQSIIYEDGPILYFGKNVDNDYVLGLSIDEDDEARLKWYIHAPVSADTLYKFFSKKVSFLAILKSTKQLYVFQRSYDASDLHYYLLDYHKIPKQYLPLNDSYCPTYFIEENSELINSLKMRLEINFKIEEKFARFWPTSEWLSEKMAFASGENAAAISFDYLKTVSDFPFKEITDSFFLSETYKADKEKNLDFKLKSSTNQNSEAANEELALAA